MVVLVTGGTGFIGSHTVAAVLRGGHRVRLLVRDPDLVDAALLPLGVSADDVERVIGDATDPDAVAAAVRGCTAVIHAAGVYSFDARDSSTMRRVNALATEVVLTQARAAGCDPVVHVSTFGALLPSADDPVTVTSAVGTADEEYLRSKADAEYIARRHQDDGAPVVITYPLACLGPFDPKLGDQTTRVRNALRGLMPIWPSGGFPVGDVRDVARLHAAVLRPGLGPRRYLAPGRYVSTREFVATLRAVTGRALPTVFLPARAMLPMGRLTSLAQRVVPVHIPAEYGAIYLCAHSRRVANDGPTAELVPDPVELGTTLLDTVRWLRAAGQVSARQAGVAGAGGSHSRTTGPPGVRQ